MIKRHGDGPRILIIEDDPANRLILEKVLGGDGYQVRGVASGRSGLQQVEQYKPQLVILDVGLDGIDGYEVCRRIRNSGNHVPVLFVTGHDDPAETVKGFEAGGDDYIVKPYNFEELKARVRAALRKSTPPHTLPVGDLRRFLALRAWPVSLAVVFFCLAQLSNPYPGLPDAQIYSQIMAWGAFVSTSAVAVFHYKPIRYLHVFFAFSACMVRSLFGLIGWTNDPNAWAQLLGAASWGCFALAVLTIYMLTLPFVVDEQIEKTLAV